MVLAIDVGNTNVVLGGFEHDKLCFISRISSSEGMETADEIAIKLKSIFDIRGIDCSNISGSILSSVVPAANNAICEAVLLLTGKTPFIVGPGIKTGINIRIDNPAQLGSDLLVDCVAAANLYEKPVIVADMGTATTLSIVDENNCMRGGAILPGVKTSLNALIDKTAQLPQISISSPKHAIGTNTNDCMRSGIVLGNASMLDGMIERFEQELGRPAFVVATGGLSGEICKYTKKKILHNPNLLLEGLYILYKKNELPL